MVAPQPAPGLQQSEMVPLPDAGAGVSPKFSDTWNNVHAFQVFDGAISKQQATADAHRYEFVWGTSKPSSWKSGNPNIITSYYAPFDGDFTTHHNLAWWQANHASWVLYKCDKKTPAGMDGLSNVALDISNRAVVKWQMATYVPVIQAAGYDALAEDLVGLDNANGGCGVWINKVWVQRFTGQKIDDTWTQAVLTWHRYAYKYLHNLSQPLQLGVNHVPENRPYGDPEEKQLLNLIDFIDDESSFTDYGNGYAAKSKVLLIVQWMKYIQSLGKPYIVDDKWNTQSLSQQQFEWSMSTYLMGKYHYASVFIDHLPGYGYEYWYPQYTAKLGHPCGDMYADPLSSGVYYRKFTHGFIVLNTTTSNSFLVTLPLPTYTDLYGNTITSPMTIKADDGQVLLTPLNGCL